MMSARNEPKLPRGYRLDEGDSDFVFLIRPDGSRAAVFSAMGASRGPIKEAAERDLRDRSTRDEEVEEG